LTYIAPCEDQSQQFNLLGYLDSYQISNLLYKRVTFNFG